MNFWPRFIGDYQRDTADLDMRQDGAYGRLLDFYYATENALPGDLLALFRIARALTEEEQKAVVFVRDRFFRKGRDGKLHHRKCDEIIQRKTRFSNQKRAAANVRWNNALHADALQTQSMCNATHIHTHKQTTDERVPLDLPFVGKNTRPPSKQSTGTRLPQDWKLSTDLENEARKILANAGRNGIDIINEAEKFRDYWHAKAGAQARKVDWTATWRNWIRNAKPNGAAHGTTTHRKLSAAEETELGIQRFKERQRLDAERTDN